MGVVPKGAKHRVDWDAIPANTISKAMMEDDSVGPDEIIEGDDYIMGTLEAAGKVIGLPIVTKNGHHTGVALADLTATFGAPAGLSNGSMFTYKNDTDSNIYLVVVVGSVFQIEELTPVTA